MQWQGAIKFEVHLCTLLQLVMAWLQHLSSPLLPTSVKALRATSPDAPRNGFSRCKQGDVTCQAADQRLLHVYSGERKVCFSQVLEKTCRQTHDERQVLMLWLPEGARNHVTTASIKTAFAKGTMARAHFDSAVASAKRNRCCPVR